MSDSSKRIALSSAATTFVDIDASLPAYRQDRYRLMYDLLSDFPPELIHIIEAYDAIALKRQGPSACIAVFDLQQNDRGILGCDALFITRRSETSLSVRMHVPVETKRNGFELRERKEFAIDIPSGRDFDILADDPVSKLLVATWKTGRSTSFLGAFDRATGVARCQVLASTYETEMRHSHIGSGHTYMGYGYVMADSIDRAPLDEQHDYIHDWYAGVRDVQNGLHTGFYGLVHADPGETPALLALDRDRVFVFEVDNYTDADFPCLTVFRLDPKKPHVPVNGEPPGIVARDHVARFPEIDLPLRGGHSLIAKPVPHNKDQVLLLVQDNLRSPFLCRNDVCNSRLFLLGLDGDHSSVLWSHRFYDVNRPPCPNSPIPQYGDSSPVYEPTSPEPANRHDPHSFIQAGAQYILAFNGTFASFLRPYVGQSTYDTFVSQIDLVAEDRSEDAKSFIPTLGAACSGPILYAVVCDRVLHVSVIAVCSP